MWLLLDCRGTLGKPWESPVSRPSKPSNQQCVRLSALRFTFDPNDDEGQAARRLGDTITGAEMQDCKTADRVRQPTAELMLWNLQTAAGAVAATGLGHTTECRYSNPH